MRMPSCLSHVWIGSLFVVIATELIIGADIVELIVSQKVWEVVVRLEVLVVDQRVI